MANAIWIPEGHQAFRRNGESFAIEATLSSVRADDQLLYTFILRDIDERTKNG